MEPAPASSPPQSGLQAAFDLRRKDLRLRLAVAAAISLGFIPVVGWRICLIWGAVYCGLQIAEARWLLRARPAVGLASMTVSSFVFASMALTGPSQNGAWGLAAGVTMICGALLNTAMATLKSRAAFIASYTPFALSLGVLPIMAIWEGAATRHVVLLELAAAYVAAMGFLIWRAGAQALRGAEEARARAEAADHAKSAFVAMVSHELRTPINAMLAGAAEAATATTDRQRQENLDLITGSARMMRTLLNDLLDLSKLEAGKMTVEQTAFDLPRLIEDCTRFWEPEARTKGLNFRVEGADALPAAAAGDPTRIHQILNNLFSNAFKFTAAGEVSLHIEARPEAGGWRCAFTVADTGLGMTTDQAARLFQPYSQADASVTRTHGGTGLGLSISRQLAVLMGGDLTLESEAGRGSRFTLSVVLAAAELAPETSAEEASLPPLRILAADDHPFNRKALELILGPVADRLVVTADGADAVAAAETEDFDIVLLDLNMETMGGLEAARLLRKAHGPALPILALTGSVSEADHAACLAAGMNGLVAKPVEPAELMAAIAQALQDAPMALDRSAA